MSTSTELRRIIGTMTERPWKWTDGVLLWNEQADICVLNHGDVEWNVREPDRDAIATLANHADALVALVEACERLDTWNSSPRTADDLQDIVSDITTALSCVHTVKDQP